MRLQGGLARGDDQQLAAEASVKRLDCELELVKRSVGVVAYVLLEFVETKSVYGSRSLIARDELQHRLSWLRESSFSMSGTCWNCALKSRRASLSDDAKSGMAAARLGETGET